MTRRYLTLLGPILLACGGGQAVTAPPASGPAAPPAAPTAAAPSAEATAPASPPPSLADLERQTIMAFYAAFSGHDTKKLASLYAADAVSAAPGPGGMKEVTGPDAIVSEFSAAFNAMPDLKAAPL